jgi:Holliday junction resolvase RusA-like endonuclease
VIISAYGEPAPQGSKRVINRGDASRAAVIVEANKKTAPWRSDVITAARASLPEGHTPWDGPVVARMVFSFWRPKSVPYHKRPFPSTNPPGDLCKLARSTEDALKAAGVFKDDSRIVEYTRLAKVYVGEDPEALESTGCFIVLGILEALKEITVSGRSRVARTAQV